MPKSYNSDRVCLKLSELILELEDIYRRDLNLFIALRVLIEEGSVSRAAQRLSLSQSAMSRVLGRLRIMLEDPLFTRHGQQLIATEKALAIDKNLSEPLDALRHILSPQEFEPQYCEQTFHIAMTDYAMQTVLPFILKRLYQAAPELSLNLIPLQHTRLFEQLTYESVDLAICRPTQSIQGLSNVRLGKVGVLCLVTKNHPLADKVIELSDYLTMPNALIAISDGVKALIDQSLQSHPARKTVLRAYHLEAALAIADMMPLIMTVPADLAYMMAKRYQLKVKPLPFEFAPFDYSMIWHPRCEYSKAHEWLRSLVIEECRELIGQRPPNFIEN